MTAGLRQSVPESIGTGARSAQKTERPLFGLAAFDWLRVKDRSGSEAEVGSLGGHVWSTPKADIRRKDGHVRFVP